MYRSRSLTQAGLESIFCHVLLSLFVIEKGLLHTARGAPPAQNDDGTITPTAPISSRACAPEAVLPVIRTLWTKYQSRLWTPYGIRDAFNSGTILTWYSQDVIRVDQGPCDTERVPYARAEGGNARQSGRAARLPRGNIRWFESRKRILLLPIEGGEFRQDDEDLTHPVNRQTKRAPDLQAEPMRLYARCPLRDMMKVVSHKFDRPGLTRIPTIHTLRGTRAIPFASTYSFHVHAHGRRYRFTL